MWTGGNGRFGNRGNHVYALETVQCGRGSDAQPKIGLPIGLADGLQDRLGVDPRRSLVFRQNQIPCKTGERHGWNRGGLSSRHCQVRGVGKNQIRFRRSHRFNFSLQPLAPCAVKLVVLTPGCLNIDPHGTLLNATDVLLDGTDFPRNLEAIDKECFRNGRA